MNIVDAKRFKPVDIESVRNPYLVLSRHIDYLHGILPAINKIPVDDKMMHVRYGYHGFTTYPLDWRRIRLPSNVKAFFEDEGIPERLNVSTNVFVFPNAGTQTWDHFFSFWLNAGNNLFELEIKRRLFYENLANEAVGFGPYDAICPLEESYDLRFLRKGSNGKLITDDPRNFHATNTSLPTDQLYTAKQVLVFAISERRIQIH